jgi:hypothetical protein
MAFKVQREDHLIMAFEVRNENEDMWRRKLKERGSEGKQGEDAARHWRVYSRGKAWWLENGGGTEKENSFMYAKDPEQISLCRI